MEPSTIVWPETYLDRRSIRVKVESVLSSHRDISSGVPQGSYLAPVLFRIYINSLSNFIDYSRPYLFADDATLFHGHAALKYTTENLANLRHGLNSCQGWAKCVHGTFLQRKLASCLTTKSLSNQRRSWTMMFSPCVQWIVRQTSELNSMPTYISKHTSREY